MINVASNRNDVDYGAWTHIDGWSETVVEYIAELEAAGGDPAAWAGQPTMRQSPPAGKRSPAGIFLVHSRFHPGHAPG